MLEGNLWKLIARMGTPSELLNLKDQAIDAIKNSSTENLHHV